MWKRLSSAGRGSGAAVATGAIAMGSGTKDALESMRDHWGKGMRKLDKWAADNFVSCRVASSSSCCCLDHCGCAWCGTHCPWNGLHPTHTALQIGRVFQFKERGAKASTEMRAGLITFLMVRPPACGGG